MTSRTGLVNRGLSGGVPLAADLPVHFKALRCAVAWAISLTWAAVILLLIVRAGLGSTLQPLHLLPLMATAGAILLWAWTLRLIVYRTEADTLRMVAGVAASFGTLATAAMVSLPESLVWNRLVFWSVILLSEVGGWYWLRQHKWSRPSWFTRRRVSAGATEPAWPTASAADFSVDSRDSTVIQQLTRTRESEGREILAGNLRADFAAGERYRRLHVAFCPRFQTPPEVYVEFLEGPDAELRVAQVARHGVRIDIQLNAAAATQEHVLMEFYAVAEAPRVRTV